MKCIKILTFAFAMNIISDQAISMIILNNYTSIYPRSHHEHLDGQDDYFNYRSGNSHNSSKYRKYYKKMKKILRALQREGQKRRFKRDHFEGVGNYS